MILKINNAKKINKITQNRINTSFNGNLPIVIEIRRKIGLFRYELKIGNKILNTKSQIKLKEKTKYWGEIEQTEDGIIKIKNLHEQPKIIQNHTLFLKNNNLFLLKKLLNSSSTWFHSWILENLENSQNKNEFQIYSYMLLALKEGVIHLPISINSKIFLFQWKHIKTLNSFLIKFYIALENLGPIKGEIIFESNNCNLNLDIIFKKTAYFLKKNLHLIQNVNTEINISTSINPLWQSFDNLLDIKG